MDRRNEVINEVLAEEVQRGGWRKKRSDAAAAATLEPEPAASAALDSREDTIEPESNPREDCL